MDLVQILAVSGIVLLAAAMAGGVFERWGLRAKLVPISRVGLGLLGVVCLGLSWTYSRQPPPQADIPMGAGYAPAEPAATPQPTYQVETHGDASPAIVDSPVGGDVVVTKQ